jgi:hypothetical protein
LSDFPEERCYFVLPEEQNKAFHLHTKYFIKDDETLGPSSLLPLRVADAEDQLKTMYRSGHLEEIKRNQFGKAYLTIRKHYSDLERAKVIARKRDQEVQEAR